MSYMPVPEDLKPRHDIEPILKTKSHKLGEITFHAPKCSPSKWAERSWLMISEKDLDGEYPGLRIEIKASAVHHLYTRPYFLSDSDYFEHPVECQESEEL